MTLICARCKSKMLRDCECGASVNVIGPATQPLAEHWQPTYAEHAAKAAYNFGSDRP